MTNDSGIPRSSNVYYAENKPFRVKSTKEGVRKKKSPKIYSSNGSNEARSSDIYYAEMGSSAVSYRDVQATLVGTSPEDIVKQLKAGSPVRVQATSLPELTRLQTAMELKVGQGKITRSQLDAIEWLIVSAESSPASFEKPISPGAEILADSEEKEVTSVLSELSKAAELTFTPVSDLDSD